MEESGQHFYFIQEAPTTYSIYDKNEKNVLSILPRPSTRYDLKLTMRDPPKGDPYIIACRKEETTIIYYLVHVSQNNGTQVTQPTEVATIRTPRAPTDTPSSWLVKIKSPKYGNHLNMIMSPDSSQLTVSRDGKPVCMFKSPMGDLGTAGGEYRIAKGERRNFITAVITVGYHILEDLNPDKLLPNRPRGPPSKSPVSTVTITPGARTKASRRSKSVGKPLSEEHSDTPSKGHHSKSTVPATDPKKRKVFNFGAGRSYSVQPKEKTQKQTKGKTTQTQPPKSARTNTSSPPSAMKGSRTKAKDETVSSSASMEVVAKDDGTITFTMPLDRMNDDDSEDSPRRTPASTRAQKRKSHNYEETPKTAKRRSPRRAKTVSSASKHTASDDVSSSEDSERRERRLAREREKRKSPVSSKKNRESPESGRRNDDSPERNRRHDESPQRSKKNDRSVSRKNDRSPDRRNGRNSNREDRSPESSRKNDNKSHTKENGQSYKKKPTPHEVKGVSATPRAALQSNKFKKGQEFDDTDSQTSVSATPRSLQPNKAQATKTQATKTQQDMQQIWQQLQSQKLPQGPQGQTVTVRESSRDLMAALIARKNSQAQKE